MINYIFLFRGITVRANRLFADYGGVAEVVHEEEVEVAVAVGAAGGGAIAGGEGGGVRLIWSVSIERGGGEVLDVNYGATTGTVWVVINIVFAEGVVGPAAIKNRAEEPGGAFELVFEAVVFAVAWGGVGAAKASGRTVLN